MLELLGRTTYSPGTMPATKAAHERAIAARVDTWPDTSNISLTDFWAQGQGRSLVYEPALKRLVPRYDRAANGFGANRPDLVIKDYKPCSILSARNDTASAINTAIQRQAHLLEFTAQAEVRWDRIATYLRSKLLNYVEATREQ
jgi:hypothetical protein